MFKKIAKKEKQRKREDDENEEIQILSKRENQENIDQLEQQIRDNASENDHENSGQNDEKATFNAQQQKKFKRHKGVSLKDVENEYDHQIKEHEVQNILTDQPTKKTVGLISAGGKQPQFQFTSLGHFEIKDNKLEEFLKTEMPKKGKSDYELELERTQKEQQEAKLRLLQEQKDLYKIPEHLDVDKINQDRRLIDHTNWVNGLIEVPVSQDKKIKNVEEAERMRLQLLKRQLNVEDNSTNANMEPLKQGNEKQVFS